ncbi:MAG: AAA family ATPase [Armatimonadetes bacterium]|nr:AAA family ATPase [Armatimonadota bacterium]
MSREYRIGDVAQALGVTRKWIEKRERDGILPAPRRSPGNHRTYNTEELRFIIEQAKAQGLRIPEEGKQKDAKIPRAKIAVINQKGGPGKTTLTQNLAASLARRGFRCLLVDLDRQGSLTICFGVDIRNEKGRGVGSVLKETASEEIRRIVVPTYNPGIDLVPGNEETFEAEIALHQAEVSAFRLREQLNRVADDYDFTLIDCPPDLGKLTMNGLVAADRVLLPVDHNLSYFTIEHFSHTFRDVRRYFNPQVSILGTVMNKFDPRTTNSRNLELQMLDYFNDTLFETRIPHSSKVPESQQVGQAVVDYDSRCSVSVAFQHLTEELLQRVQADPAEKEAAA